MSNKKKHFNAKGYYIALVLCAAAIGVSGYLYYRNTGRQTADVPAAVINEAEEEVSAGVNRPGRVQETTAATEPATQPKQPLKTAAPVEGDLVAEYSMECLSYNETTRDWRVHGGCDYAATAGTEVKAAADGEVYTVYEDDQMGMTVVIRHQDGYTTHYASLADEVFVKAGDKVSLGQSIGTVGSTALMESALPEHVCFSVTRDGETVDPAEFLNAN